MYLKVEIEDIQTQTYALPKPTITIGASSENNVIINVNSVSRKHLKLIKDGQNWFIEDQGSTNGSYLSGKKLSPGAKVILRPNAFVRLGDRVFIMLVTSAEKTLTISNFTEIKKKEEDLSDKTRVISLHQIREAEAFEKRCSELLVEKKKRNKKKLDVRKAAYLFGLVLAVTLIKSFLV